MNSSSVGGMFRRAYCHRLNAQNKAFVSTFLRKDCPSEKSRQPLCCIYIHTTTHCPYAMCSGRYDALIV